MAYYAIEFVATINGTRVERGKIGSIAGENDYKPNIIKDSLERHFRSHSETKSVGIVIIDVRKVTAEQFNLESFIALGDYQP